MTVQPIKKKVDIDIVVSGFCSSHVDRGSQSMLGCLSCMENCLSDGAEKHLTAFFACKYILLKGWLDIKIFTNLYFSRTFKFDTAVDWTCGDCHTASNCEPRCNFKNFFFFLCISCFSWPIPFQMTTSICFSQMKLGGRVQCLTLQGVKSNHQMV